MLALDACITLDEQMGKANKMDEFYKLGVEPGTTWNLRALRKSSSDKKIAGVCGGFGEYTPIPSWLWRVAFISSIFLGGLGLIGYIILWISMPAAKPQSFNT